MKRKSNLKDNKMRKTTTRLDLPCRWIAVGKRGLVVGHSASSHNFMVGCLSGLIIGQVAYSKRCKICEIEEKKQKDLNIDLTVVAHCCPRKFPILDSSKYMESRAAVLHCCNLSCRQDIKAYVSKLVTDDNSTTRANLQQLSLPSYM
jgi:hypothetical protein